MTITRAVFSLIGDDAEFGELSYRAGEKVSAADRALLRQEGYTDQQIDAEGERTFLLWYDARTRPADKDIEDEVERLRGLPPEEPVSKIDELEARITALEAERG